MLPVDASWLAVYNPSPTVVLREVGRVTRGLLAAVFWHNPLRPVGRAAFGAVGLAGLVAGMGRGLAAGALPLAFAAAYLAHGLPPILPRGTPALWAGAQLGSALGLWLALLADWAALRDGAPNATTVATLAAAALPAALLRFWLHHLTGQLEAAATVGLLLVGAGALLAATRRATRAAADGEAPALPPWLAGAGGVAAGLMALPGISVVAVFWATAVVGRLPRSEALRFALMAAAPTAAVGGLLWLPAALGHGAPAMLPAALPAALLRFWLHHLTGQLEAAATVGLLLVGGGALLAATRRATAAAADGETPALPPWLAGAGGVAAGLLALPGISVVAVFWATAVVGRLPRSEALRFALMAAAPTAAIGGLLWLPAALGHGAPAMLPAALGACAGAWAGARLLRAWVARDDGAGWIGLCSVLGALLLVLGVFAS